MTFATFFGRFAGIYQVKNGVGRRLVAHDADGTPIFTPPVVPTITPASMSSADAWPGPGSTITITLGTVDGVPVDGVLTLDGSPVTPTGTGGTRTYVIPAGGTAERALVWTPESGAPVSMTVYPALKAQSTHYLGASNTITGGTAGAVTGLTSEGLVPLTFNLSGTAPAPSIGTFGLVSQGGQYFNCTNEPATAYEGTIVIMRHKYPGSSAPGSTQYWLELSPSSGLFNIAMATGGDTALASGGNISNSTPNALEVNNAEIWIGYEIDYANGQGRHIASDGTVSAWQAQTVFATFTLSNIRALRLMPAGAEVEAYVFARAAGQSYPSDFRTLWHRAANLPIPEYRTDAALVMSFGQSNNIVSGDVSNASTLEYLMRGWARMPTGMALTGGGTITSINGAGGTAINQAVAATWGEAKLSGTFGSTYGALATYNAHSGATPRYLAAMSMAQVGTVIGQSDDDPATGTDTTTTLIDNGEFIINEVDRLCTAEGLTLTEVYAIASQGGADANQGATYANYRAEFEGVIADIDSRVTAVGATTRLMIMQMNGSQNTTSFANGVHPPADAQIDVAEAMGAPILPSCWYPTKDGLHLDNSINLLSEALMWMQLQGDVPNPTVAMAYNGTDTITATIQRRAGMALARDAARYTGGISNCGFEVEGGGSITGTPVITGNTVSIPVTGTITAARYMHQQQDVSGLGDAYVAKRGELYLETGVTSAIDDAQTIRLPVLPVRVAF